LLLRNIERLTNNLDEIE